MPLLEGIAVAFGLTCVILTIRQNIWCWPAGLVQVVLYLFIFHQVKLYSDVILHWIYVVLQIYGWYHWLHNGGPGNRLPVTSLSLPARIGWPVVVVACALIWGYIMDTHTDASIPYGDAFTTVASLVAQWLMARKRVESWLFWITVDVVAIGIYWQKELYLTAGLYGVFLVLATLGWHAWRKAHSSKIPA